MDARLAQFNAEHGHRLFSSPGRVAAGAEEPHDAVAGSAPPTLAAKKNSEEILTTSDEGEFFFFGLAGSETLSSR